MVSPDANYILSLIQSRVTRIHTLIASARSYCTIFQILIQTVIPACDA